MSSPTNTKPHRFESTTVLDGQPLGTFVLAGGCFWCLDAIYQRTRGVHAVLSGYIGGHTEEPDYFQVCNGTTGHAEAVAVLFDQNVVPASVILDMFFTLHDPTTLNRQGHDVGTQYRSAMFPLDQAQREQFQQAIDKFSQIYPDPIVTTLEDDKDFWFAENIHQDYYTQNANTGYCRVIIDPKLQKIKKHYGSWLKSH